MKNKVINSSSKKLIKIEQFYKEYYKSITCNKNKSEVQFVILTHTVSDVAEFISAINDMGKISIIISIPYSKDEAVYSSLSQKYKTITPSLNELLDPIYLKQLVLNSIDTKKSLIIVEIGGYFSSIISEIQSELHGNLIGIVEDTEAGHRKYERINEQLPCPVLSVARSRLKDAENFLVGESCLKAANSLLNSLAFKCDIKNALVLGYGKIGQGVCQLLKDQQLDVFTYDIDPSKRLLALSRNLKIPDKKHALSNADALFGASGAESVNKEDLPFIKNGCVLFSCSSKQVEFDLNTIKQNYTKLSVHAHLDKYENADNYFYVAGDGHPINFTNGRVLVGPLISIVHGEMLSAISEILALSYDNALQEISDDKKLILADKWINTFCNAKTGTYCHE